MKLAKGLEVLNIPNPFNPINIIYLTLIYDKDNVILIDTGNPGNFNNIKIGLLNASVSIEKLNKIIITHQDFDNIGGIYSILNSVDQKIEILAHSEDKPYIEGEIKPIKMTDDFMKQINSRINSFSKKREDEIKKILDNFYAKTDKTLNDGEELPICGGIKVIYTPGHTPGHLCLYLKKYKTLIASDALNIYEGELYGPDPNTSLDITQAVSSLEKLTNYDIQKVICYHNGVYKKNVNKRIKQLFIDETNELL